MSFANGKLNLKTVVVALIVVVALFGVLAAINNADAGQWVTKYLGEKCWHDPYDPYGPVTCVPVEEEVWVPTCRWINGREVCS